MTRSRRARKFSRPLAAVGGKLATASKTVCGKKAGIFGTKERSVISAANAAGIQAVVDQQFAVGAQVLAKGLMPILEPEVTITIADKAETTKTEEPTDAKKAEGTQ